MRRSAILLTAVALAACGKSAEQKAADSAAAAAAAAPLPPPPPAAPPTILEAQVVGRVMAVNEMEVDAGKAAASKATSADVKAFGRQMVTDHEALSKALKDLTGRLNITAQEDSMVVTMKAMGKQAADSLKELKGAAYDKAYITHQVNGHQMVLDELDKTLIPSATSPEFKDLLTQARATVDAHLQTAKRLQAAMP